MKLLKNPLSVHIGKKGLHLTANSVAFMHKVCLIRG